MTLHYIDFSAALTCFLLLTCTRTVPEDEGHYYIIITDVKLLILILMFHLINTFMK